MIILTRLGSETRFDPFAIPAYGLFLSCGRLVVVVSASQLVDNCEYLVCVSGRVREVFEDGRLHDQRAEDCVDQQLDVRAACAEQGGHELLNSGAKRRHQGRGEGVCKLGMFLGRCEEAKKSRSRQLDIACGCADQLA